MDDYIKVPRVEWEALIRGDEAHEIMMHELRDLIYEHDLELAETCGVLPSTIRVDQVKKIIRYTNPPRIAEALEVGRELIKMKITAPADTN